MTEISRVLRIQIGPNPPPRLDRAIARHVPVDAALSRTRIARLISEGAVFREGHAALSPSSSVREGDEFEIHIPDAEETEAFPERIPLRVAHEDGDLIVVDKPAGMVVHPAPGSYRGTLVNALLHHCGDSLSGVGGRKRPGIVHRIDKDTSGLLVVAKNDHAHHWLSRQFESHEVERRYLALARGRPDPGDPRLLGLPEVEMEEGGVFRVASLIDRHRSNRQRQRVSKSSGRRAVTRFRAVEAFGGGSLSLLECWLETGRTHQIRTHLSHIGHAVVGDALYGGGKKASARDLGESAASAVDAFPRQALHARSLGFAHPDGRRLFFESPIPSDMRGLLDALRCAAL